MGVLKIIIAVLAVVFIILCCVGVVFSCYYSIPYAEWVKMERAKAGRSKKERQRW